MKIIEIREKTVTVEHIKAITCDWCGCDMKPTGKYEVQEQTLEFTKGKSFPDGGSAKGWKVGDLCDPCVDKLRELLIANGIRTFEVSSDW